MSAPARIPRAGGIRELGPINWAIAKLGARGIRAPRASTCSPCWASTSCCSWRGCRSPAICCSLGKLSRKDAELVILRVGHLRNCEYELQQHRRLARSRGVGPELQAKIFEGPDAEGLTERQRALITATDEFVITRGVSPETLGGAVGPSEPSRNSSNSACSQRQYDATGGHDATLQVTAGLLRTRPCTLKSSGSSQVHHPEHREGEQHRRDRQAQQERRPDIRLLLIPSPTHAPARRR